VLNNFAQVSNELLVSLVSLAREGSITHSQKTIRSSPGFSMLGVLGAEDNSRSRAAIAKLVPHYQQPRKTVLSLLPNIDNPTNQEQLSQLLQQHWPQLGYLGSAKLWKRITHLRRKMLNLEGENLSEAEANKKLWGGFFTQQFMEDIELEVGDLINRVSPHRLIAYQEKYRQIVVGRVEIQCMAQPSLKVVKTQYALGVL
jgi:hypothetical protein